MKINPTLAQIIQELGLTQTSPKRDNLSGIHLYSGTMSSQTGGPFRKLLPESFYHVPGWVEEFRYTWISDEYLAIACWCEGSVSLFIGEDVEAYKRAIQDAHNVYVVESPWDTRATSIIPQQCPIAQLAIDTIPGLDDQNWRQSHLFISTLGQYSFDQAVFSHREKKAVISRLVTLCMMPKDQPDKFKAFLSKEQCQVWDNLSYRDKTDYYFCFHSPNTATYCLDRSHLIKFLVEKLPNEFQDFSTNPFSHPELKCWGYSYFSEGCQLLFPSFYGINPCQDVEGVILSPSPTPCKVSPIIGEPYTGRVVAWNFIEGVRYFVVEQTVPTTPSGLAFWVHPELLTFMP